MVDLIEIKNKMKNFFDEFQNINTPDEAMEKFKEIFKDEYVERFTNVDEPYYESHSQSIYLKDGYGIGIVKSWGPFDFAGGGLISHFGEDVVVFSELADEYISLFESSKKEEISAKIDSLYNIDISTKNLLSIENDLVYDFIPESELENTDELFISRYKNLKMQAELKHNNDIDNDLISYYGGLDVTIHSTEYYLYNSLLRSQYNEKFMNIAITLFNQDFPSYFNDQINECNQALYIIENKEQYYKLIDIYENDVGSACREIDFVQDIRLAENEKSNLQLKLDNLLDEIKSIKSIKYNIIDLIKGSKKKNLVILNAKQKDIEALKEKIETKEKELDDANLSYDQWIDEMNEGKKKAAEIEANLKYPFKDFTLNPNTEDAIYLNGEYALKVSLDRLVNEKNSYIQKLRELNLMKGYVSSKILTLKNEKEEIYEKTI